jgi:hypothetical protein
MNYAVILLLISILLVGRAVYVALQIKKPEKAGKYGANPKTVILVMAAIGAVCFVISSTGFAAMNNKSPSKSGDIEIVAPLKTWDNFASTYNKYAEKFGREIIDDWSFTDEGTDEGNSKAMSLIFPTGATMSIHALREPPYYVVGTVYFIESADDQLKTIQNLSRLYVLIETFESGEPGGNVVDFVQRIITSVPGQIIKSENNISYYWQDDGNDMTIYIDTSKH